MRTNIEFETLFIAIHIPSWGNKFNCIVCWCTKKREYEIWLLSHYQRYIATHNNAYSTFRCVYLIVNLQWEMYQVLHFLILNPFFIIEVQALNAPKSWFKGLYFWGVSTRRWVLLLWRYHGRTSLTAINFDGRAHICYARMSWFRIIPNKCCITTARNGRSPWWSDSRQKIWAG